MREEYVLEKGSQLLKERNWTLYRLAKEADISYSTLSNTFHRNNVPSVSTVMRICEGFGITLSEFFDEGGTVIKQLTTSDQKLVANFHRLPREDKKLVDIYMKGLLKIAIDMEKPERKNQTASESDMQEESDTLEKSDTQGESDTLEKSDVQEESDTLEEGDAQEENDTLEEGNTKEENDTLEEGDTKEDQV